MKKEKGQVVLILVLVMTVALAIGISVIQRSLSDISTASKLEQSSRAFSAAEAGIEKALRGDNSGIAQGAFDNQATATIQKNDRIPAVPAAGSRQSPLEYPPLAKEETAHVWLADLNSASNPPADHYQQGTLEVYWGSSSADRAALELTLVYHDGSRYINKKWYIDQIERTPDNNFSVVSESASSSCSGDIKPAGFENTYRCWGTLSFPTNNGLMLIRARLLYNSTSQPFAVRSTAACPAGAPSCNPYSLPPQARIVESTGFAGQTSRKVKVFLLDKVVPPYLDYAIFSGASINKP